VSVVSETTVSTTALAAEPAEERPRALITAAPRCCTVAMKSSFSHSSSPLANFHGTDRGRRITATVGQERL
jgi:hypothetical protein